LKDLEIITLDGKSKDSYSKNLGEFNSRNVLAIIKPKSEEDIRIVIKICSLPGGSLKIFSYSSGKNWGLGSFLPTQDDCILVDLSFMNQILYLDLDQGIALIEAGVTQGQLSK